MTVTDDDQGKVIRLTGRLTAGEIPELEDLLKDMNSSIRLDLSDLRYISSAGLGILAKYQRQLTEAGNTIKLVNPTAHVREIFRITALDQVFDIE